MPIVRINAEGTAPQLHRHRSPASEHLRRIGATPGPVIVMIHGYKYQPHHPVHCPHMGMMSRAPVCHTPSWPRWLGFEAGHADEGLAVAFGWSARGALWHAQRRAVEAGRALAQILSELHDIQPERPMHVIAHSMGTEVALEALYHLPPGVIRRILSLTGACFASRVTDALETPAGRVVEFFNMTSRENDVFDAMFEWLVTPPARGDRAIGQGLVAPNALTVELDCPDTLDRLETLGAPIAPSARRVCHWSSYTRPGVMRMYNAMLRQPELWSLPHLRAALHKDPAPCPLAFPCRAFMITPTLGEHDDRTD